MLGEFLSPPKQAHDDKEISIEKKRTPEFRLRDSIRHGGDHSYGKDADRKTGGPCYLLAEPSSSAAAPDRVGRFPTFRWLRWNAESSLPRWNEKGAMSGMRPPHSGSTTRRSTTSSSATR